MSDDATLTKLVPENDWRALVDPVQLTGWMDAQGLGSGAIEDARILVGGTQNLLLQFRRGGRAFVLRRPSRHPRANANDTMLREARLLAALAATEVRHPRFIAACADTAVIGTAFFLMDVVDGVNISTGLPALHAGSAALRRTMGFEMVDALLALGEVDPVAVGLADFGKSDGFLQRQVPRWRRQLESYQELPNWPGAAGLPEVDAVGRWLEAHVPAQFIPGILHGDFHLANVMFRHDGAELAAVIDWEMATLGDPLLDLGWLLATWPNPDGTSHGPQAIQPWQGFPVAEELIERYAAGSRRDLSQVHWYAVMACYKLAIVLEGSYARACAGQTSAVIGERLHSSAAGLLRKAAQWIQAPGAR
ncbi:MAG: phosphotransferase family protein [Burkholderiales bacterium]